MAALEPRHGGGLDFKQFRRGIRYSLQQLTFVSLERDLPRQLLEPARLRHQPRSPERDGRVRRQKFERVVLATMKRIGAVTPDDERGGHLVLDPYRRGHHDSYAGLAHRRQRALPLLIVVHLERAPAANHLSDQAAADIDRNRRNNGTARCTRKP